MIASVLALVPLAACVALFATWAARTLGQRIKALDGAGVPGQVKEAPRRVPNTGGVGIMLGFGLPLALGLVALHTGLPHRILDGNTQLLAQLPGLQARAGDTWIVLACALTLHTLGLFDDRRPLGPWPKLLIMLVTSGIAVTLTDTRLLTLLDAPAGGSWLSIALTVVWIGVVINAMNFLDNMDGLSAGVGLIGTLSFLAIALLASQWFVGSGLALLVGSLLGFLWFNKPHATIFMGDGGSLVLGFLLAFFSVRITYADWSAPDTTSTIGWYAALAPLVVLAVPLYDFTSVVVLRLSQGKSPFVGDLQHISHRFVRRGFSKPAAVALVCGFAGAAGLSGIILTRTDATGATLVATLTLLLLSLLAMIEFAGNNQRDGSS